MVQKLRERMGREEGFTLVELLVVMLILGLLAAIAIPSFFNQRDKARDADAKAAARTAQTAIETYATDNNGSYAGAIPGVVGPPATGLVQIEPTLGEWAAGGDLTVTPNGTTGYTVAVTQDATGNTFSVVRTGGTTSQTCTTTGNAGCPSDGNWGD